MSRIRPQWLDAQQSDHWSLADILLREEEPDEEEDKKKMKERTIKMITMMRTTKATR